MSTPTSRPLALVTGASSGIGYQLTRLSSTDGCDLVITATSVEGLATTTATGAQAVAVARDLTQFTAWKAWRRQSRTSAGRWRRRR
jgi:short-subunit dehydrogenase